MSARVLTFPKETAQATMTKRQLAHHLHRSERFIEARQAEGMPHGPLDRLGRRLYALSDVQAWLDEHSGQPRRDRLSALEERVRALEERLGA